jgi:hypothetical protein
VNITASATAEGLRGLARLYELGLVPADRYSDLPTAVMVFPETEAEVRDFARLNRIPIQVSTTAAGDIHTTAELTFTDAVTLRAVHILPASLQLS